MLEFWHFMEADVVISKRQVNVEGLTDVHHEYGYFPPVAKLDLITNKIATNRGDYGVRKRRRVSSSDKARSC